MKGIQIYEFGYIGSDGDNSPKEDAVSKVPENVFNWLREKCFLTAIDGEKAWLRWTQRGGNSVIQVTSFVGVICTPDGYQIEVLPKVGKAIADGVIQTRKLLINMLSCMHDFRHIQINYTNLSAAKMPLLEVFISEFLRSVECVVKRGLRSNYREQQDNLFAMRGKLLVSAHLRQNLARADRFFTQHDEFTTNRPENRLIRAALKRVLLLTGTQVNHKFARDLDLIFSEVPTSTQVLIDFQQVRLDRGMNYYSDALAWARLILNDQSPLSSSGNHNSPSLLFPMEAVFEAYVAKHLPNQLTSPHSLKTQARSHHLVTHCEQDWFQLKPDLLIKELGRDRLVLDTKWKLIDAKKSNAKDKYGLSQGDFYQLLAYGSNYLDSTGELILIYPRTDDFCEPLPEFIFSKNNELRLWVLPFCLKEKRLKLPTSNQLSKYFN